MSREARHVISKLIEIDYRKRYRASELMREPWIKCHDMGLSIFESAGTLFRANSMDRTAMSQTFSGRKQADGFNNQIIKLHNGAIDHLKSLGFSGRAIDDSMKTGENNKIFQNYKEHIDDKLQKGNDTD